MSQHGFFLLVTRDEGIACALGEPLQRYSVVRRTKSSTDAAAMLLLNWRWSGVVVDLDSVDADPLEAVKRMREAHRFVPILAMTSGADDALINGLHAFRAELVVKPIAELSLLSFVRRALVNVWLPDERVAAWADELARSRHLTPREVQLMAYALGNQSRAKVIRWLGITENTLKTQVRSLLRKCNARSMDGLARAMLHDALVLETQAPDPDRVGTDVHEQRE